MRTLDSDRLVGRRYRTYKFIYRFCSRERMEPERFWALPFDRLRFRLGESYRNLKVPFATAPALTNALTEALDELLVLARIRHSHAVATSDDDREIRSEMQETVVLPPLSYRLDDSESPPLHERVIAAALGLDPWLDPALLRAWMGEPGRGAGLIRQLSAAYRKAFVEERRLVRTEPTTYLTQLAVLRHLLPFWNTRIAAIGSAAFAERVEIASAIVLHAFFDEMVHAAFENPVLVDSTMIDVRAEYLLKTSCSPLTFLRDPASVLRTDSNPYGFAPALYTEIAGIWRGFDPLRHDLDEMVDRATRHAGKLHDLVADAVEAAFLAELRRHAAAVLLEEGDLDGFGGDLARLACDASLLRRTIGSRSSRNQLVSRLEAAGRGDASRERFAGLAAHVAAAGGLRKDPAKAFGRAVVPESLLREAVRAVAVFQLDLTTRQIVEQTASLLLDRRMEDRTVVVAADYDAGRLYRIAGDEHPILRAETAREEAHLFLDLKDFTKKTHSLKELNMADFLKGEFYGPLLRVARDLAHEGGTHSIALNNLLGDALSFSGDVKTLVEFGERAAETLDAYRDKLRSRMPESVVRGELKRLERQYQAERVRIADKRAQLESILRELSSKFGRADGGEKTGTFAVGAGLIGEVTEATNALYKLEEREAQIERELAEKEEYLTGGDLVAGVFLSHGAPAMVLKIVDPVFGEVKVAIAEKINEAARGTARNAEVKRRLDLRVKEERERTGEPRLEYPFRVYIDKIWSLTVPPWMSEAFRKALEEKDVEAAGRVFNEAGRAALAEFSDQRGRKGPLSLHTVYANQDIYNAGVALSEQALGAYQRVTGKRDAFFVKTVDLTELPEVFHERFAFDTRRLRLVFAAAPGATAPRHVFRYAGSMVFRGFEQRTAVGVYELLNPRDPFHRLLVERCFGPWYKAFREKKGTAGGVRPFEPNEEEEPTDPGMRGDG